MLIDEVEIKVKAGDGGSGRVSFHREKFVPKGGPDGGDGGKGGDVYLIGVEDITALRQFRFQKEFSAENGKDGGVNRKTGASGEDLELKIPVGTVIKDAIKDEIWEMKSVGQKILVGKGGRGGRGNWHFRSAVNQTPLEYEKGTEGEQRILFLELRLIADIGLIGLPSVGKSSLLNALTKAHAKVASYNFTTLEPNLGVVDGLIIADLPGLIEGAHQGRGLGIKFLKHVQRTKILMHCISAESSNPLDDYEIVRKELSEFDTKLLERPEIILLTKSDLASPENLNVAKVNLRKLRSKVMSVSIYDSESLEQLKQELLNFFGRKENKNEAG